MATRRFVPASERLRLTVEPLEARLTPSFSVTRPMSATAVRQYTESRADMYTLEAALPPSPVNAAPDLDLAAFTPFRINLDTLSDHMADAPEEFAAGPAKVLALPRPDGTFDRFNVWEVSIMEPGLAAQFPDIRTWRGQGIDDPTATLAADLTVHGFHAQVLSPNGRWYVDPYYHLDSSVYAAYFPNDLENRHAAGFDELVPEHEPEPAAAAAARDSNGLTLRTYRTAVAATGEYTAFFGGTQAQGQAAIVTAVNRVSGLFETELAVRLVLVANNINLVYTNASTDPYTNNSGSSMLSQNQSNVDAVIGSANYDLGHVFSTGGGGVAFLGVVGEAGWKARGVTGSSAPVNDAFYVDYVIHEMGHQFGANHTFNGVNGSAAGNQNDATAYEPGSGSTIMAYAGICGADDLQAHSDAYFHVASLDEITDYIATGFGAGFTQTATGNNIPTAAAGPDRVIPIGSPFSLTGVGTDADAGDVLTYDWEQYDLGPNVALGSPDNGASPLFRSFNPTTSPTRLFPKLSTILSGGSSSSEIRPTVAQTMTFRLTVRDNRATGAFDTDTVNVQVVNTGATFAVTSPNTNVLLPGGSTQTVTWNVAGTAGAPINVSQVNILLSTDGGNTFPTVLAAGVANDGSADVALPNLTTTQARIKVEAVGNIFFDVSNVNFRITAVPKVTGVSSPAANGTYGIGQTIPIAVTFNGAVTVTGLPRLALNSGGVAEYASGSGTTTLTFNYVVGGGQNSADLDYTSAAALGLNGGTVTATATGLAAELTLPAPGGAGSLGANKDLVIDSSDVALVAGVTSPVADGTYGTGAVIPITVTFDRPVAVTGSPQLALNAQAAVAGYVGGSGTDTLTFNYTVADSEWSTDLDYDSGTALTLNGGTIVSPVSGDVAVLDLPAPGAAGSLGGNKDIIIGIPVITLEGSSFTVTEDVGTVAVTVLRTGAPTGAVSVDYTVFAGTAAASDYTVTSDSPPSPLTWAAGDTTPRTIEFQITQDALSEGPESFALALSNLTGLGTIDSAVADLTIRQSDGLPPGKFGEADGDIATVSLTPKTTGGSLLVYLTNNVTPISLIETTGTDPARTVVALTVKKARLTTTDNGTVAVGSVVGTGVKALNLGKARLTGGIQVTGMVQSLRLDSIADGADVVTTGTPIPNKSTRIAVKNGVGDGVDVTLTSPLASFRAASFGDGTITAPRLGTLSIKGNFGGDVTVSGTGVEFGKKALGTLRVGGTVDGSTIDVTGIVGTVAVGSFLNSRLSSGYDGTDNGVGTYDPFGVVTSFRTKAKANSFFNSSVIAATIKTVTLETVNGNNGGVDKFGIYADTLINTVTVKLPLPQVTYRNPTALTGFEDFEVGVV